MYLYRTQAGDFSIIPNSGRWYTLFQEELLGTYTSPEQAAFDLSVGHVLTPPVEIDFAALAIPRELSRWEERK